MIGSIFKDLFILLISYWWLFIPPILLMVFFDAWLIFRRAQHKNKIVWKLLELRIPKEVLKTPKAMEQVFASIHAIYSFGIGFFDKWWKGKLEDWLSFELVGRAGHFHFFVRTPEVFRNLVESAIYAQYPDAEINEVDDYVHEFSPRLPDEVYDLWGGDFVLAADDIHPIKTYPHFEENVEERRIDPVASIAEVMTKLKESEAIWLQFVLRAVGNDWKDKYEEETRAGGKSKKTGFFYYVMNEISEFTRNLTFAFVKHPDWPDQEEKKPETKPFKEVDFEKPKKLCFEGALRFVYIDRKDSFTRSNISAVMGFLRQFSDPSENSFKLNSETVPSCKWPFKQNKAQRRKRVLFDNYRVRHFPHKFSIFNVEELATVYHFPLSGAVKASILRRIESKRGGPPAGLPTV